jgi:hypothetical protein
MSQPVHAESADSIQPLRRSGPVSWRRGRILLLRAQVEQHAYVIDCGDVAESMLDAALEVLPPKDATQ